jgi:hypothetical protein
MTGRAGGNAVRYDARSDHATAQAPSDRAGEHFQPDRTAAVVLKMLQRFVSSSNSIAGLTPRMAILR